MAEWTAAYINDLPDSAFAYVESGGEKDEDGKTTPRNLRHFPHHDTDGQLDLPHLRNALSRGPQSNVWPNGKGHLESHAKAEGVGDRKEPSVAKTERRYAIDGWQHPDFQMRATGEGDSMTFEGYAAVFDIDSDGPIPGWGVERIAPGAFKRSLGMKRDIRMFLNHNGDLLLASRDADTLELKEDDVGLLTRAQFIDTTVGLDTAKNVRAKNITKMSFGFTPDEREPRSDGVEGTLHTRVALWEVSPITTWPAYDATSASVRHLKVLAEEDPERFEREAEDLLERLPDERLVFLRDYLNRHSTEPLRHPSVADMLEKAVRRMQEAGL